MKNLIIVILLMFLSGCSKKNSSADPDKISDIDGNIYHETTIGTQIWMVENLRVTHFNDGADIQLVTSNVEWKSSIIQSYCWYYNIVPLGGENGALYNFYAVNTGKLCPTGWHVPSDDEWKTLEMFLGMSQAEADTVNWRGEGISTPLKSVEGWSILNEISDYYGFTALPVGFRQGWYGDFEGFYQQAFWWTSTYYDETAGWMRNIVDFKTTVYRGTAVNQSGLSVRCVKDNEPGN